VKTQQRIETPQPDTYRMTNEELPLPTPMLLVDCAAYAAAHAGPAGRWVAGQLLARRKSVVLLASWGLWAARHLA
jgi:hypothetical protein